MTFGTNIHGIADVNRILSEIAPKEAVGLLRATTFQIAKDVAEGAKDRSPDDTGTLDGAIQPKRERGTRTSVAASVRVARRAFYWRFLELGQGPDGVEYAMFLQTLQALRPDLDRRYLRVFVDRLVRRLARRRQAKGS